MTEMYPCDRGMGGLPVGYHMFQAGPTGVICCIYCGAQPFPRITRMTC